MVNLLEPWVDPKLFPLTVTRVPLLPDVGVTKEILSERRNRSAVFVITVPVGRPQRPKTPGAFHERKWK